MAKFPLSRRDFIRIGTGAAAAGAVAKATVLDPTILSATTRMYAGERVRFASIGTGVRGCELLKASLRVPNAECVAVCDLYDSRHKAAQEAVGKDVPATRNYKEILDRKDVDAVIVATMSMTTRPYTCLLPSGARSIWVPGSM